MTRILKTIETIVMDTCVIVKYGAEGLNGALKNCYFAQRARGGKGSRSVIGLSLRDVTIFDCFPCNGIT